MILTIEWESRMDENNNLQLQCWDIMLFARSNIDVVFPKRFSKYPFHNK
jgi:hypothetical protein